jgi:hypothetical protein
MSNDRSSANEGSEAMNLDDIFRALIRREAGTIDERDLDLPAWFDSDGELREDLQREDDLRWLESLSDSELREEIWAAMHNPLESHLMELAIEVGEARWGPLPARHVPAPACVVRCRSPRRRARPRRRRSCRAD